MRTQRPFTALMLAAGLVAACGPGPTTVAGHSPAASTHPSASTAQATPSASAAAQSSPTPTINPVTGAYGVLVTPVTGSGTYTVTLVGVDGKIVASAQASSPPSVSCANSAAALVPLPVSTSNSRAYFMDGTGAVHWIDPTGAKSPAAVVTLPAPTSSRRSLFAVSPDDAQMAVVVIDFTSSGATTNLYRYDLNAGGTQSLIFTQTGAYTLWPVGWHGTNNLVLGKIAACTQGGGPFTGTPTELHVVDPATANRRFTIGSSTCPPVNRPSPAGVICENPPNATVLNWTNTTLRTLPIQGPVGAYLSPSGANVAFVDNTGTIFTNGGSAMAGVFTCAWIDDTHVLAGGDPQNQARVGNLSNGSVVPVAAQGDCGGRIPGGL